MAISNDPITVDPASYHAASSIMGQEVATQLLQAMNGLTSGLSGSGAMAGSDESGQAWAAAYDEATSTAVGGMSDLVNACHQLAAMLEQSGFNHSAADDASNPAHPTSPDTTNYAATLDARAATPPSAKGGSGNPPWWWGMIEHAVGYLWPNGDPGRLRDAGRAWSTAANGLHSASSLVPQAVSQIQSQKSPEVQDAVTVCQGMVQHINDAADGCHDLANGCSQYADHIDQAHQDIENEINSLLWQSAAIEAGSLLLSEIGGEFWGQGIEAGRIAATGGRIAKIIERLFEAARTVAQSVRTVVSKVSEIAQRLKAILGARLSSATTKLVEKLGGQANTAEETAIRNLGVWAKDWSTRGLEIEEQLGGNLPRSFPTIDKFENGVATSIKSVDLTSATYQNTSALASRLRGYVDKIATFNGATWGGTEIDAADVTQRVLQVAIQPGVESSAQRAVLDQLDQYAASKGVKLIISEVP